MLLPLQSNTVVGQLCIIIPKLCWCFFALSDLRIALFVENLLLICCHTVAKGDLPSIKTRLDSWIRCMKWCSRSVTLCRLSCSHWSNYFYLKMGNQAPCPFVTPLHFLSLYLLAPLVFPPLLFCNLFSPLFFTGGALSSQNSFVHSRLNPSNLATLHVF